MAVDRFRFVASLAAIALSAGLASAHKERPIASPVRPGPVPDLNRPCAQTNIVCKASSKPTKAQLDAIKQDIVSSSGPALEAAKAALAAWKLNSKLFRKCHDPFHTIDGIQIVQVRSNGTVVAKVRGKAIAGAIGSDVVSATVRVGDGEESCSSSGTSSLKCKKYARL